MNNDKNMGFRALITGGILMTNLKNVKVKLTLLIECNKEKHNELEYLINGGELGEKGYSLDVLGNKEYEDNVMAIYIIMNTEGSYEKNLQRLSKLHLKIDNLLKKTSIKYRGMSLVPNKVKWDK